MMEGQTLLVVSILETRYNTCRHMGIAESSPSCDICNLIKTNFASVSRETRMQYGNREVDYRENMDDNGMVSISVPVELAKNVEHYMDAMIALDYVKRNYCMQGKI